jgi:hypothetical protein
MQVGLKNCIPQFVGDKHLTRDILSWSPGYFSSATTQIVEVVVLRLHTGSREAANLNGQPFCQQQTEEYIFLNQCELG